MSDLVLTGFNLAMYGMGFVLVFLLILVALTNVMSALVRRFSPAVTVAQKHTSAAYKAGNVRRTGIKAEPLSPDEDKSRLVAILSAAIKKHRSGLD